MLRERCGRWKPAFLVHGQHQGSKKGFFDVSSGLEEASEGCGDQVDHGRKGCGVAVAAGSGAGGLEQAVQALDAGVAVRRRPALEDALDVLLEGGPCLAD